MMSPELSRNSRILAVWLPHLLLVHASERRLRLMLLVSEKSVFSRGFDVGSIV